MRVVQVNREAERYGVKPGHTLAEAAIVAPELIHYQQDVAADRVALESLAAWANCLSPIAHIEGDDCLLIDVTGCKRLFGDEMAIIDKAVSDLAQQRYSVSAAIADTPGAAWALAHASGKIKTIAPAGQTVAEISRLPVWSLRIGSQAAARLHAVGVDTVEALLHLPRASLARRFGEQVLYRVDQALGNAPEILDPFEPRPLVRAQVRFTVPTQRLDLLREAVDHCLKIFCDQLEKKVVAVRRAYLTFFFDPYAVKDNPDLPVYHTVTVDMTRPTRNLNRLHKLITVHFDALKVPANVDSLQLWADNLENCDAPQRVWFGLEDSAEDETVLADLIDRLMMRMGKKAIFRAEKVTDYQPELAYTRKQPDCRSQRGKKHIAPSEYTLVRPLRLLARPARVAVTALVPDGPPVRFHFETRNHLVTDYAGPERIETGWWRSKYICRDYYRVESDNGCRYWMFRDRNRSQWFVHGYFD